MIKKLKFCLIGIISLFYVQSVFADSPFGRWVTIDDKTSEKRAIVELFQSGNVLNGRIVETFPHPGEGTICTKCPGAFKGQVIKGLQFMWGLKNKGHGIWDGGHVLDAKSGKIYHVKLKTLGDNKLLVRGYIGISMLGRTQIWVRA